MKALIASSDKYYLQYRFRIIGALRTRLKFNFLPSLVFPVKEKTPLLCVAALATSLAHQQPKHEIPLLHKVISYIGVVGATKAQGRPGGTPQLRKTTKRPIMKKLFVSLFLSAFLLTAHGQLTKGNWLAGGTGKFYSYNSQYSSAAYSNEASYTQIDLSPNVGYFVADKLAFGIRPTFSSIKGEVTTVGGGRTNVQRYWIGPFGRYYFLKPDRQYNILTDIGYQYGIFGGGLLEGDLSTFSALAGPVIYFNNSVGLEFLLGYSYSKEDAENANKEVRKGFQLTVGFQIHLE